MPNFRNVGSVVWPFIGNTQTDRQTHTHTHTHTSSFIYIDIYFFSNDSVTAVIIKVKLIGREIIALLSNSSGER